MALGFLRRSESPAALARSPSLAECAATAYRAAKDRKLPLAYVAERHSLGPQFWFADSLLRNGAVYGKHGGESVYVLLSREHLTNLTLAPDMSALRIESSPEPRVTDLRVPPSELKRYLRWASTVQ